MARPYARAERGLMVAEAFCVRDSSDEYSGWLGIRHKDHSQHFLTVGEEGYIEFHDLKFVETGRDEMGAPEGFEPIPMMDSEDLRWIARLADEFSEKETEQLLQDVKE